jgi:hypothetical protein
MFRVVSDAAPADLLAALERTTDAVLEIERPRVLGSLLGGGQLDDEWLSAMWSAGAATAGLGLVLDALRAGTDAAPIRLQPDVSEVVHPVHRDRVRRHAWEECLAAASATVFGTEDPEEVWPLAQEAMRAAAPDHWHAVDAALDALPGDLGELVRSAAADTMAAGGLGDGFRRHGRPPLGTGGRARRPTGRRSRNLTA